MSTSVRLVGFIISVMVFAGAASTVAVSDPARYCNQRFGFCVDYPQNLEMEPPPVNNDGRRFHDRDGFLMIASGINNSMEETLHSEMESQEEELDTVTYRKFGSNWYVLSGFKGPDIVYLKTYVGRGSINRLYIKYRTSLRSRYDKMVDSISRSFVPGQIGVAH